MLYAQKGEDYDIYYRYDEKGVPIGFLYSSYWQSFYQYAYNAQGDIIGILDGMGYTVASYSYDAWGVPTLVYDDIDNIGSINPLRYRGYYYDNETGFYYVSSRYYDPEIGRWINADGFVSTGQDITGYNMFAYCGNNPVNRADPSGQWWEEIWEFTETAIAETRNAMGLMSSAYAGCAGAALADGPLPFGDTVALAGGIILTATAIGCGIYQAAQAPAIPKAEEKSEAIPALPQKPTVIYRYYASKNQNLAPRPGKDFDGLSFSTKPPRLGVPAVVTTIEHVNATGILTAIPTGGTHITVKPTNGTVNQWMSQGQSSIWSQTLSLIVVEWDRSF